MATPLCVGTRAESAGEGTRTDPTVAEPKPAGTGTEMDAADPGTGAEKASAGTRVEPAVAGIGTNAYGAMAEMIRLLALTETSVLYTEAASVGAALASAGPVVALASGCFYSFCRNGWGSSLGCSIYIVRLQIGLQS